MLNRLWQIGARQTLPLVILVILVLAACGTAPSNTTARPAAQTTPFDTLVADLIENAAQNATPVPDSLIAEADAEYVLLGNLYERLAPSVVFIEVIITQDSSFGAPNGGNGSGFVYDLNGHIVTNAHVVKDADVITVRFNDGYIADAEVVGVDTYSDLAVIRVNVPAERLIPIPIGDSDIARVGDRAVVIGNPFGLASSMTSGIISAKGRQIPSAELLDATLPAGFQNPSIIQVDANINPGNSGGPLLNSRGEVIGVNTAIRTETGVFEGVGFAVPSSTVRRVIPELIADGAVNYAWIGISAMSAADGLGVASLAEPLNLPVSSGVLVSTITQDSPAAKAGLRGGTRIVTVRGVEVCTGGDIIVAVDDRPVHDMDELVTYLVQNSSPGDEIVLRLIRDRETLDLPVLLEARPTEGVIGTNCGEEPEQ
ncbi:MAG: S1C family serine protease [Phototrophicaceae bacterium]|jgi:S1-C subfamily serine protease